MRKAPHELAPEKLLEALRALQARPIAQPEMPDLPENSSWVKGLAVSLKQLRPTVNRNQNLREAEQNLKDYLHSRVIGGKLLAIGYALPRSPTCTPVRIPTDVWNVSVDWDTETVSGNGMKFVAVRIAALADVEQRYAALPSGPLQVVAPARERPSQKEDIFNAYQSLKQQGAIDPSKSMASHYEPIRSHLCKIHPDRAGQFKTTSDETIRQVISPEFKEMQRAQKQ